MKPHAMFSPSPRILAAVIIIVSWGLITNASYAGTGDEPHNIMMAYSLAFDHNLDLAGKYGNADNRALRWLDPPVGIARSEALPTRST